MKGEVEVVDQDDDWVDVPTSSRVSLIALSSSVH